MKKNYGRKGGFVKVLLLSCASLSSLMCISQPKVVFQVLHADSAFKENVRIQPLDELALDDSIQPYGLLALVHQTGAFVSIEGNSLINIQELDSTLLANRGMLSCENEFPDLRFLFTQKERSGLFEPATVQVSKIDLLIPSQGGRAQRAFPNQEIALWWRDWFENSIDTFKISIYDLFYNEIGLEATANSYLKMALDRLEFEENLVIIKIGDSKRSDIGVEAGFILDSAAYFMPDAVEATTAIKALEIAYYLDNNDGYAESKSYYELACKLSPHLLYKTMLTNHQARGIRKR